jgi:hypothetical protein
MGRRSRRAARAPGRHETATPPPPPPPRRTAAPKRPRARLDEAPKAPWSPFPLVELAILAGLVLIVAGFLVSGPRRGPVLGAGIALVTLAGLELAIREHFSGFRSHSVLLAAACAIAVNVPLYLLTELPQELLLAVAVAVFGAVFWLLRLAFRRRAGGLSFRA